MYGTRTDWTLILIDHQSCVLEAIDCDDPVRLEDNVVALAAAARAAGVPTVVTTLVEERDGGPLLDRLQAVLPDHRPIDRSFINPWRDPRVVGAIEHTGRRTLVLAGLWTEVCVMKPALAALQRGYRVLVVTDASAGTCVEAHDCAVERMARAGAVPVTTAVTAGLLARRGGGRHVAAPPARLRAVPA